MKRELTDLIKAPTEDKEFPKKFAITVLASLTSAFLVPGIILLGFLAELIERKSQDKPGLPEWSNVKALGLRGAICVPTLIYLLPGTLVIAIGAIASSSGSRTIMGISLLSAFIDLGGLLLTFMGAALAFTAIHTYVHSKNFVDLFAVPQLIKKLTGQATEMAKLCGVGTFASLVFLLLGTYLGWAGYAASVLGGAFLGLSLAGAVGTLYGKPEESSNAVSVVSEAPKAPEAEEEPSAEQWVPDSGHDDEWKPS